jgi:hypothetical protein
VDTRAVQQTATDLNTQITAIRQSLADMQRQGMPAAVSSSDPNVRRMLTTLTTLSTQLGSEMVPISGSNDQEKFASLNRWLNSSWRGRAALSGRTETSGLDSAAVDELQVRLEMAIASPSATAGSTALLGLPQPQAPPVVVTAGPVTSGPVTGGAVPARTDDSGLLLDLEVIAQSGRSPAIRTQAGTLRTQINAQTTARRPNATTLGNLRRQAERLITAELDRSIERMNEQRAAEFERVTGAAHPLTARISALATNGSTESRRLAANIWLVGDRQMTRMTELLEAGNVSAATDLFNSEQALYAQMLERYVIPAARASVTEIHGSSLPTTADLRSGETRMRMRAGTLHNIPIREGGSPTGRILRRVTVGREDLERIMQRRLDAATALQGQRGNISFNVVSDLFRSVQIDERMLHFATGMWDYARDAGLDASPSAADIWSSYVATVTVIADPQANPFALYGPAQRDRLMHLHLGIPQDRTLTAAQISTATRELTTMLMQNDQLKYEYTVYNFFDLVRRMRPPNAQLEQLARVRSARATYEYEYLSYRLGFNPDVGISTADWTAMNSQQRAQRRYDVARGFLEHSISTATGSGMGTGTRDRDQAVISAARAWLSATAPTDQAALQRRADIMYDIATSLSSLREAEMWSSNASFRQSSLSQTDLDRATAEIALARQAFLWNFSSPQIDPTYHENLARVHADRATRMLAPRALQFTEPVGLFSTLNSGFLNPAQPSPIGEAQTPTDAQVRTFHHLDASATITQEQRDQYAQSVEFRRQGAAVAEQAYLTMLVTTRGSSTMFSPSATDTVEGQDGALGAFRTLDFRVGRLMPATEVNGYPILRPVNSRRTFTITPIDQHAADGVAHEDLGHIPHGALYMELHKQFYMDVDTATPALLHGLNVAPDSVPIRTGTPFEAQDTALRQRLQAIARELGIPTDQPLLSSLRDRMLSASSSYGTGTMADRQRDENRVMLAVLDARIAQLDSVLDGYIQHSNGRPVRVADLDSSSPLFYYVTRAREARDQARTLRGQFATELQTDLLTGRINPREAIAIAEIGIDSMTPEHAGTVPVRPGPDPNAIRLEVTAVPGTTRWRGDEQWQQFTANVDVLTGTGRSEARTELTAYESRQHTTLNLTYNWIFYTDVSGRGDYMVVNPHHHDAGHEGEGHYIGRLMRGIRTADGRTADAVVRVRAPGESTGATGSRTIEWEPVRDGRGAYDILFEVQGGTLVPSSLDARALRMSVMTTGRTASLHVTGPTQAVILAEHNR